MKTLFLPLKSIWYNMISSGEKQEEYREIKPHWIKRICGGDTINTDDEGHIITDITHIRFSYGYTKRTMTREVEYIKIGKGKKEWGAPDYDVFIIKLK